MPGELLDLSTSNSAQSQTITLDIRSKMIEEQYQAVIISAVTKNAVKVGFVSRGCLN